jgi:hypothetical protein
VWQTTSLTLQFDPLSRALQPVNSITDGGTTAVALKGIGTAATHAINLSWEAPVSSPDPVTGYQVDRVLGTGTPVFFNPPARTTLDFADNAVVGGTTYRNFVKSVDAAIAIKQTEESGWTLTHR